MSETGYKLASGADLSTIFSPYATGNPQAAVTGYQTASGADLNTVFNKYVSGDKAAPTGYQIASGEDLNAVFRMPGWVWNAVGTGLNNTVRTIAFLDSSNIFVGGSFTNAGGIAAADNIARWNSNTNTWSALGTGTDDQVYAITILNSSNIFVGGSFSLAGGVTNTSFVAKWNNNTNTWSALRTGLTRTPITNWPNPGVYTIACLDPSNVFIGGNFDTNDGTVATWSYSLIRWNNNDSSWSYVVPAWINSGPVYCIAILDAANIFIAGPLNSVPGQNTGTGIFRWNNVTSVTSSLLRGLNNNYSPIYCISILDSSNIFVGGVFRGALSANGTTTLANTTNIARWNNNTNTWSALGSGIRTFALDPNYAVYNICVIDASTIFVGGIFPDVNNIANTSYMALWNNNTSTWTALSERPNYSVWAYYKFNNTTVFVGGDFTASGSITSYISKYSYS
jgi:hypothetical protein